MNRLTSSNATTVLSAAAVVVGITFAGQVVWFLALYPLIPNTGHGWFAAVATGFAVTAWAAACSGLLLWFKKQQRYVLLFRALGLLVAVSLGVGIFAAAYEAREFISANSSYFGR